MILVKRFWLELNARKASIYLELERFEPQTGVPEKRGAAAEWFSAALRPLACHFRCRFCLRGTFRRFLLDILLSFSDLLSLLNKNATVNHLVRRFLTTRDRWYWRLWRLDLRNLRHADRHQRINRCMVEFQTETVCT